MNLLSNQQRLTIYKKALSRIRLGADEFMCNAFCKEFENTITGVLTAGPNDVEILSQFPELMSQKPKKTYSSEVWYDRKSLGDKIVRAKRIDVLKRCIKMTERIIQLEKE